VEDEIDPESIRESAAAGIALEPFHLKQEMENGYFDEQGHYIRKDFEGVRDAWLDSLEGEQASDGESRLDRKVLASASEKRSVAKGKERGSDNAPPGMEMTQLEAESVLRKYVQEEETVAGALRRLKPVKHRQLHLSRKKQKQKQKQDATTAVREGDDEKEEKEEKIPDPAAIAEATRIFERVTEAADWLYEMGRSQIYEVPLSQILVSSQVSKPPGGQPKLKPVVQWEYQVLSSGSDTVYGPFSSAAMLAWKDGGLLGDAGIRPWQAPAAMPFRKVGEIKFESYD
jgi:CD2 antigen cytoplasmic tail-binding protein 2